MNRFRVALSADFQTEDGSPAFPMFDLAPLIELNPEPTPLSHLAKVIVRAPSGEALPAIVESVRERQSA